MLEKAKVVCLEQNKSKAAAMITPKWEMLKI